MRIDKAILGSAGVYSSRFLILLLLEEVEWPTGKPKAGRSLQFIHNF